MDLEVVEDMLHDNKWAMNYNEDGDENDAYGLFF